MTKTGYKKLDSSFNSNKYNDSTIIKMILLIITISMMVPSTLSIQIQIQINKKQQKSAPGLKQYVHTHLTLYNLQNSLFQKQIQVTQNNRQLYVYSSTQHIELCYQYKQNDIYLPILLQKRSYHPIQYLNKKVKCFQVFSKIQMLQQPTKIIIQQVGELQNLQQTKKKTKKQIQYLQNQYLLAKWLHNFYVLVNSLLRNATNKLEKSLNFDSLQKFSALIIMNVNNQIAVSNIWRQKNHQQNYQIFKKLAGKGLHQHVTYTIDLNKQNNRNYKAIDINQQQCEVHLLQAIPHTSYIDIDQMKSHGFKVVLQSGQSGDGINYINVQRPSYESRQYQYKIIAPWALWKQSEIRKYQIKIPVHFRYANPYTIQTFQKHVQSTNKKIQQYVEVQINPISKAEIICYSDSKRNINYSEIYRLQENYLVAKGAALIPIGDGAMKSIVNIVTLGSQVICALLLVKQLRK